MAAEARSRKQYVRADVLAAAMGIFWEQGYQGASIQNLCTRTGLNRKTLYAEFGDKKNLFEEALTLYTDQAMALTRGVLSAEPLGLENLRRYFSGMTYEPNCRGCLMTMTVNERRLVPDSCITIVSSTLSEIESLFVTNLRAEGLAESEVQRLATFLVYSIQGITTMGKLHGDNQRLAQVIATVLSILG